MTPDLINGLFETIGALFICRSIKLLHRQKQVHGVSVLPTSFFASWGAWNLYYYPHLHQWWSFSGGVLMVTINTIWVMQMAYYLWRYEKPVAERKSGLR